MPKRTAAHGDIDPNVKIPRAVQAAAAKADDVFKSVYTPASPEPEAPAASTAAPTPPSNGDQELPSQDANLPGVPQAADPAARAESTPAAPSATTTGNPPSGGDIDWKHRFESMKGRYDQAERRIQEQAGQLAQLNAALVELQGRLTRAAPPPASDAVLITPEEEEQWGQELLKVVEKKAKQTLTPIVDQIKQELKQVGQQVQGVGSHLAQDARSKMYDYLDAKLPAWTEINDSDEFKSWVGLPDAYSGATRLDLLRSAYERNDGPRVLNFFKGFLAEEAAKSPASGGQALLTPAPRPEAPVTKVNLVELAAPGRAKTPAAASAPVEKPLITRAQIAQFYRDVLAGKYRGRDADKTRLEGMIFEAERDGRIR